MKTTFAIIALITAFSLAAAVVPEEVRGTWVVTGYRFGGISALSEKEAKAWIGRSMTIGKICVSLEGKKIHLHDVVSTEYDTETYFWGAFRIKEMAYFAVLLPGQVISFVCYHLDMPSGSISPSLSHSIQT